MGKSRDRAGQEAGSKGGIVNERLSIREHGLSRALEADAKLERAEELATQVRALADARHQEKELRKSKALLVTQLERVQAYKDLIAIEGGIRAYKQSAALIRLQLDEAAIAVRWQDGETKPHPAVQVKMSKVLKYDGEEVVRWAMYDCRIVLALNVKLFEHLARDQQFVDTLPVGLVTTQELPKTSVARDLNEFRTPVCVMCEGETSAWGMLCSECVEREGEMLKKCASIVGGGEEIERSQSNLDQ